MISTGVVRKIDDLGRIVIPKEIRKSLGIRDGENLEIFVDNDNIKLIKKSIINGYIKDVKEIASVASQLISGDIIVTDREKVVYSSNKTVKENSLLSDKLIEMIDQRMSYNDSMITEFLIGENALKGYFLISPVISEGNSLGLIIIYNGDKQVSDYYLLVRMISLLIVRRLDITC